MEMLKKLLKKKAGDCCNVKIEEVKEKKDACCSSIEPLKKKAGRKKRFLL